MPPVAYIEKTKADPEKKEKIIEQIRQITPFFTLIKHEKGITAVVDNKHTKTRIAQQKIPKLKILTKKELKTAEKISKGRLILHGSEFYPGV